jgi:hypothetical protein
MLKIKISTLLFRARRYVIERYCDPAKAMGILESTQ